MVVTLNDLERRTDRYFALSCRIWWIRGPITSQRLKLDPMRKYYSTKTLVFGNMWAMMIFSDITWSECAKERHPPLDSDNSTCTILRRYLSNSWALILLLCVSEYSHRRFISPRITGWHQNTLCGRWTPSQTYSKHGLPQRSGYWNLYALRTPCQCTLPRVC